MDIIVDNFSCPISPQEEVQACTYSYGQDDHAAVSSDQEVHTLFNQGKGALDPFSSLDSCRSAEQCTHIRTVRKALRTQYSGTGEENEDSWVGLRGILKKRHELAETEREGSRKKWGKSCEQQKELS